MAQNDEALLAGLKALSGVNDFSRECCVWAKPASKNGASGCAKIGKPASGIASITSMEIKNENQRRNSRGLISPENDDRPDLTISRKP